MHSSSPPADRLGPHWKGHILWFDPKPLEPYGPASGLRLLLVVVLVEGVLGPRLGLLFLLGLAVPPMWVRVPLLLALVLALVYWFAGVKPSQVGFRSWASWSPTERSYFVQVILLANLIFGSVYAGRLAAVFPDRTLWSHAVFLLPVMLLWGLYQEVVYRGILQTELVRRWGAVAGILVANTLYTFGPLHFYHFERLTPAASVAMFGGIFAIGLFFALVFHRSHNLWMVGIFHGIGNWYIVGLGSVLS
jgi:uncharacterized protein